MSFSVEWKYWNKHSPSNPLLYIAIYRYNPSWRRNGNNDEKWPCFVSHQIWAQPCLCRGRSVLCWPVLLQNIKSEESKPSSTTSNSSSQSKVSKKVRYIKYGEISLNLLRIIIQYSNIIYLTNTCFNSGLKLRNKKFSQFDVSGKSDLSENDLT